MPAELSVESHRKGQAVPLDARAEAALPVGHTLADALQVVGILRVAVLVDHQLSADVGQRTVLADEERTFRGAFVAQAVHRRERLTLVSRHVGVRRVGSHDPRIDAVAQFEHAVAVERPVGVGFPLHLLGLHERAVDRNLPAPVADAARVAVTARNARSLAHGHAHDLVLRLAVVVGDVEVQAAAEQPDVGAHLPRADDLGLEVEVGRGAGNLEIAGEIRRREVVRRTVGLRVVTHLREAAAQFHQIDDVARRAEVDQLVQQHAGRNRRIEIGVVAAGQRRRPVVAARDVEVYGVAPRERDQSVDAVGLTLVGVIVRLDAVDRVGQRIDARLLELLGGLVGLHERAVDDASAQVGRDIEARAELAVVLQQEVGRELQRGEFLLAVHAVFLRIGTFRMADRAQVAREVETAAEHQVEALVKMEVQRRVAVHAVAVERVDLLVGHEIGVVLTARKVGVLLDALLPGIPVLPGPVHVDVGRHAPQRVHDRTGTVTHHGQVVVVLAVVGQRGIHREPLVDLVVALERNRLLGPRRIGDDRLTAVVGHRETDRVVLVDLARNRERVGRRPSVLEKILEPVAVADERRLDARTVLVDADAAIHVEILVIERPVHLGAPRRHVECARALAVDRVAVVETVGSLRRTLSVDVLEVGRGVDLVDDEIRGEGHRHRSVLPFAGLRRDDDGAVGGLRTVEGGRRGAFQHRDVLDVLGVDVARTVAVVDRIGARLASGGRGVEHRHAVDHEQCPVVVEVDRRLAAQRHAHRTAAACVGFGHGEPRHLARKARHPVGRRGRRRKNVALDLRGGITQRFLLALHTQRRHDHVVDGLRRADQGHVDRRLAADVDILRLEAQEAERQLVVGARLDAV